MLMTGLTVRGVFLFLDLDDVYSLENLYKSANECARGVRWKMSVQMFEIDKPLWLSKIYHQVHGFSYKPMGFKCFSIVERGKLRHIKSVHISERTVQKVLCKHALKKTLIPKLIFDNYASIEGKGTDMAIARLKSQLSKHYRKYGLKGGILLIDIYNFFGTIPHNQLLTDLKNKIRCSDLQFYISMFIDAFPGYKGLGLGSEISQISAMYYPTVVDNMITKELHFTKYGRYSDDSWVISDDLEALEWLKEVIDLKYQELGLQINRDKTRIQPFRGGDFEILKKRWRIESNGKIVVRLTRQNIRKEFKKIDQQRLEYDQGIRTLESIWCSHISWKGYAKKYNAYDSIGAVDRYFYKVMDGLDFSEYSKGKV